MFTRSGAAGSALFRLPVEARRPSSVNVAPARSDPVQIVLPADGPVLAGRGNCTALGAAVGRSPKSGGAAAGSVAAAGGRVAACCVAAGCAATGDETTGAETAGGEPRGGRGTSAAAGAALGFGGESFAFTCL